MDRTDWEMDWMENGSNRVKKELSRIGKELQQMENESHQFENHCSTSNWSSGNGKWLCKNSTSYWTIQYEYE